jgi:hypothetical protein
MNQILLNRYWMTPLLVALIVFGAILFHWAKELAQRFNAWTMSLRERSPRAGPAPPPEALEMNMRILKWILRFSGACFIFQALLALVLLWKR